MHIGSDTQLVAPVTIGRGATIGAGTTVWKDVPPESARREREDAGGAQRLDSARRKDSLMCGIVGAVARDNVVPILIEGIRRLEYRGYDSTGLAVINGSLQRLVSTARVADLAAQAGATPGSKDTPASRTRAGRRTARRRRPTRIRT